MNVPAKDLHNIFRLDRATGRLFWLKRDRNLTGKEAGGIDRRMGYRRVRLGGKLVLAHHIIVAMETGEWPEEVDHINGDRGDNRPCNLRSVSRAINMKNKAAYRSNKSGTVGVHWHRQHRKWCASIGMNGKSKTLGVFSDIRDAITARKSAEKELGFHKNHGRKQ